MLLLSLLAACHSVPDTTGTTGMVGRVLGPGGEPRPGLLIESLEAQAVTDGDGRFAVPYKAPNLHVHFVDGATFYTRRFLDGDAGSEVELRLPAVREAGLACPAVDCTAELRWALGGGLEARRTVSCTSGERIELGGIPSGPPEVQCRPGPAQPSLELVVRERGALLELIPPPRVLRIEVRSDGSRPDRCAVQAGEATASPAGGNHWSAQVHEPVTVSAVCDGRPARPVLAEPDLGSVVLHWSADGPDLDLERRAPWAHLVELSAEEGPGAGWSIVLEASGEGLFALPALQAGRYRLVVEGPDAQVGALPEAPSPKAGQLVLVSSGEAEAPLVGTLALDADRVDGRLAPE